MIHHGDNLEVMRTMPDGCVDLIATDPPYCTGRDFGAYTDKFDSVYEFIEWLAPRVIRMHRILKPTGAIMLQCDDHACHLIRVLLDDVFGAVNHRNSISWKRGSSKNDARRRFGRNTDTILYYARTNAHTFEPQYLPYTAAHIATFTKDDGDGRGLYKSAKLVNPNIKGGYHYPYKGWYPTERGWCWPAIHDGTLGR